ncbi:hypothetical protein B0T16DRAFT_184986 [Cercophora newfieldiana]|uniref:Uncharacterized protein n=1 Tax=Cercophora newfieldiana TaxID=92897 RepID=A0AA39Y2X9_9PEZI|nr:hypothetical protein B0T16DRAFT_184986 [Cercophora newfieldiana]
MLEAVARSRSPRMGMRGTAGRTGLVGQGLQGLNHGPGPVSATTLHSHAATRPASRQASSRPQNTVIPPVAFPGGRNPYAERPLPPPPPPKTPKTSAPVAAVAVVAPPTAPTMSARPSTSSGPGSGSRGTAALQRPNFEKRLSKDDMSLTGQMGMSKGWTKGVQPYRFGGARSTGLPTPEDSPNPSRMPSPPPVMFVPSRVPTPSSLSSGEIQIGMALGSPTAEYTPSPLASWQPQEMTPPRETYATLPTQRTPEPPVQRQKTQKRKFFGSLFGRGKHTEPSKTPEPIKVPEPFQMDYSTSYAATSNLSLNKSGEMTPLRSNTVTTKKAPKFTLLTRSRTEPDMEEAVQGAKISVPEVKVTDPKPDAFESSAAPSLGGSGFLDVEIPDIRLERYSIMFSGVLNPQGSSTSSSLLARRQATLEKLKTINDRIVTEEMLKEAGAGLVRRATSPHMKSPSFSLFPAPQGRPHGVSPRMRSTSSPTLPSPARASFDTEQLPLPESRLRKESKRVTIISPRTMDERNRAENVEKLREQQIQMQKAQRAPSPFRPQDSTFFLDSPDSPDTVSDVEEILSPVDALPLKPRIEEPQWEIVSPPSTSALSEASSTMTKRSMSSTSTTSTNVTRPSIDLDDGEDDAALKAAVEISIARQISISRQQRNLLRTTSTAVPLPKTAPTAVGTARSASVKVPMANGLAGRVIETKQSMPRLVDMHFGRNRKSERVVLEAM